MWTKTNASFQCDGGCKNISTFYMQQTIDATSSRSDGTKFCGTKPLADTYGCQRTTLSSIRAHGTKDPTSLPPKNTVQTQACYQQRELVLVFNHIVGPHEDRALKWCMHLRNGIVWSSLNFRLLIPASVGRLKSLVANSHSQSLTRRNYYNPTCINLSMGIRMHFSAVHGGGLRSSILAPL